MMIANSQEGLRSVRRSPNYNIVRSNGAITKDGRMIWNELMASAVKDAVTNVTHSIGLLNDITRHMEAESGQKKKFGSTRAGADAGSSGKQSLFVQYS